MSEETRILMAGLIGGIIGWALALLVLEISGRLG